MSIFSPKSPAIFVKVLGEIFNKNVLRDLQLKKWVPISFSSLTQFSSDSKLFRGEILSLNQGFCNDELKLHLH